MKKFKEKKMKKLLVLLFVAAMCMPSYAAVNTNILVYKFTSTFNPWVDYSDANQVLATTVGTARQTTGYLVLNADVNTDANTWELNDGPTLIFYGGTGSNKWGVSFDVNDDVNDANGYMGTKLFSLQGVTDKSKGLFFDIEWNTEQEIVGASSSTVYGKTGKLDIGKGVTHKEGVPSSMKGIVYEWADTVDSFEALGNTTMTLNSTYTKWANTGAGNTQAQTVTKIIADLGNLGYPFAGALQARIDAALRGRSGHSPVTITVPAGTYHESIVINEPNVTLKSAAGKATTFIDPGASYQQAIEISGTNVTIDGFTIKHGTYYVGGKYFDADHPQQHTIWVHDANYSTIKNCTITGATGNNACICIGGRDVNTPSGTGGTAIYGYNVATGTKGHKILNNTFRYRQAGEGWGIFAVKLTNDSLIKGNTFYGDANDMTGWADVTSTNEGAPGIGIVIHSAEKGTGGTYAVVIEYNTAKYLKYSLLAFRAGYPYDQTSGFMSEQPENSTVNDVMVRYNTVHDNGKDSLHKNGAAVTFQGLDKEASHSGVTYKPCSANLTIGTGKAKIEHNTFYATGNGVYIMDPQTYSVTPTYGCVLLAENITISNNSIYGNITRGSGIAGYGVYNGTTVANQGGGPKTITAEYNWWGDASGPYTTGTHPAANPLGYGNQVSDYVDYTPYWTNAAMTTHAH